MDDSWKEWSKHVLIGLERLDKSQRDTNKTLGEVKIEIATLKVKSGVWGLIGGVIPAIGVILYALIKTSS